MAEMPKEIKLRVRPVVVGFPTRPGWKVSFKAQGENRQQLEYMIDHALRTFDPSMPEGIFWDLEVSVEPLVTNNLGGVVTWEAEVTAYPLTDDPIRAERDKLLNWMDKLQEIVNEQAEDLGLFFMTTNITEAYLQQAIRELHSAIEEETGASSTHLD